jgi:hypothetical protein
MKMYAIRLSMLSTNMDPLTIPQLDPPRNAGKGLVGAVVCGAYPAYPQVTLGWGGNRKTPHQ